jgi:hypothetical protein
MERVVIKASPKQLSKLRNGHKVRISKGDIEGGGFNLIVNPANYNLATKAFGKGKGVMVALDSEELSANRQVEGNGIFGKIKRGFKKAGKSIKKGAEFVGDNIVKGAKSKVGKQILTTLAKEALEKGLPALAMGAATALGQPELAPVAGKVAGLAGKQASKAVAKEIEGMGLYAGARATTRGGGMYARGGGLYAGIQGRGALLNVTSSQLPPALQSQNASANWSMRNQLPPEYARLKM